MERSGGWLPDPDGRRGHRRRAVAARTVAAVARTLGDRVEIPALRDPALADPATARLTAETAAYHNVLPLLWAAVAGRDGADELHAAVLRAYRPVVARSIRLRQLLTLVSGTLTRAAVDHVVFKGPSLWQYYPTAAARVSADVDVLVDQAQLAAARSALISAGLIGPLTPGDRSPGLAEETFWQPAGGAVVDLHWHVMREARVRAGYSLRTSDMVARARTADLDGLAVRVLDDADAAIAVATHACFDGGYRLGWLVDLALILRRVDPLELHARCRAGGVELPLAVMTDRLVRVLGPAAAGPMSAGANSGWPRSGWRLVLAGVTVLRPPARSFQAPLRGGLLYRATATTGWTSLVNLVRLSRAELRGRNPLVRDRLHQPRVSRDR